MTKRRPKRVRRERRPLGLLEIVDLIAGPPFKYWETEAEAIEAVADHREQLHDVPRSPWLRQHLGGA
jgi:hypothetical protein